MAKDDIFGGMGFVVPKVKTVEKVLGDIAERGYSLSEMNKTKDLIERDWLEWRHNFIQYVEMLVYDGMRGRAAAIEAEKLADEVQEILNRRKPEGIDD